MTASSPTLAQPGATTGSFREETDEPIHKTFISLLVQEQLNEFYNQFLQLQAELDVLAVTLADTMVGLHGAFSLCAVRGERLDTDHTVPEDKEGPTSVESEEDSKTLAEIENEIDIYEAAIEVSLGKICQSAIEMQDCTKLNLVESIDSQALQQETDEILASISQAIENIGKLSKLKANSSSDTFAEDQKFLLNTTDTTCSDSSSSCRSTIGQLDSGTAGTSFGEKQMRKYLSELSYHIEKVDAIATDQDSVEFVLDKLMELFSKSTKRWDVDESVIVSAVRELEATKKALQEQMSECDDIRKRSSHLHKQLKSMIDVGLIENKSTDKNTELDSLVFLVKCKISSG